MNARDDPATREMRVLVSKALQYPSFTPGEKFFLNYLLSLCAKDPELTEKLKRDPNWESTEGDIRMAVHRVRTRLDEFYRYDPGGQASPRRLSVPDGKPYRLEAKINRLGLDPVERFWDPHFGNTSENQIIYTEPLFFWDKQNRCYIRFLDINDESPTLDIRNLQARIPPGHPAHRLVPCFHYQSSGETQAQRILRKWFEQQGKKVQPDSKVVVEVSRAVDARVYDRNLVVLGNSRANRFVRDLQEGLPMVLDDDRIIVQSKPEDKPVEYRDFSENPKFPGGRYIYGVVTRIPSPAPPSCVTLISANHGRAIERLAEFLTNPNKLQELYSQLEWKPGTKLPSTFQLLFGLKPLDHELIAGEPKLVDRVVEFTPKPSSKSAEVFEPA